MSEPTREELERAIDNITEQLKGPLPNIERAFLAADRADMRMKLLGLRFPVPPTKDEIK